MAPRAAATRIVKTLVVVNPSSGGGATGRNWPSLRKHLKALRPYATEVFTEFPHHAATLVQDGVKAGFEEVVVVGGDGTLNEAVNGLFVLERCSPEGISIRPELISDRVRLVPIRRGTGGDFARHFGFPGAGKVAFDHLDSISERRLDLGLCTFEDGSQRERRRAFVNVASFGLSGEVARRVNHSKRKGALSFATATVSALMAYRRKSVRVSVDQVLTFDGPAILGAVGNASYFGGGVKIAPSADPFDGLLDGVVMTQVRMGELMRAGDVFSGKHQSWSSVRSERGRVVEAEGEGLLLDLDGEQPGTLPARFELIPSAVSF